MRLSLCLCLFFVSSAFAGNLLLNFAYETDPPFYFLEKGRHTGVIAEGVRIIFQDMATVRFRTLPWVRVLKGLEEGQVDMSLGIKTPDRLTYSAFSRPVASLHFCAYTYKNGFFKALRPHLRSKRPLTLEDIQKEKSVRLVAVASNGWFRHYIAPYGLKTHYVKGARAEILMLASGRSNLLIEGERYIQDEVTLLKKEGVLHKNFQLDPVPITIKAQTVPLYLLISKRSPFVKMLEKINLHIEAFQKRARDVSVSYCTRPAA